MTDPFATSAASPPPASAAIAKKSDTLVRTLASAVLAPVAIGAVLIGGWPFVLFWAAAAFVVYWEWTSAILRAPPRALAAGWAVLGVATALFLMGRPGIAVAVLAAGPLAAAALAPDQRGWVATGLAYAGAVLAGPVLLRADAQYGALALFFLFAVVWATDVLAYFGGRAIGGAKLAPAISPGKTWSGGVCGALGGVVAGSVVALIGGLPNPLAVAGLALLLSVVAQVGDLFESSLKRRFGVKDSSRIIPGHGGLMDRLDGFLVAAALAALVGVGLGGFEGAARGVLVW